MDLNSNENNVEFIKNTNVATAYFTQGKFINKLKKYAEEYNECDVVENNDGSILAHFPVKWLKINPSRKLTEEQKAIASERFKKMWEKRKEENIDNN